MSLKLPPADIYRKPFIEPIGHLAMQAAQAEQAVVELCSSVPFDGSPSQLPPADVEKRLRNWTDKQTRNFVSDRLTLIATDELREQAKVVLDQFERIRSERHRVIHDAVEIGIGLDGSAFALAVQYKSEADASGVYLREVTPEQIAELACEIYELNQDLRYLIYAVRNSAPAPHLQDG
jgi:hypothetical protein